MEEAEEREFRHYVLARRDTLLREAYLLTGDGHLAEDLVQTALAKAYVAWRRVAAADSPDAYVRRILINAHHSVHRRQRVRELLTGSVPEVFAPVGGQADPASVERLDVIRALLALPLRQRTAVVLRYWADLPEGQVAAVMGCSVGAVRSQAHRGLERLRAEPAVRRLAPGRV
ncbi:SigE family RNA polymerase sigma factor [Actinospica robiniae]|uniref:SigE family RNA polymerase sigma factor n=1 Tax=Actinospica robiniae TaxID=304901 RepID=UPI0004144259|nr:SigE family RNA polymerase sigma factor [Actinospica robiniae]